MATEPAPDQRDAPLLEAMARLRRRDWGCFGLPGHKQGRGADPAVLDVLGRDTFICDVPLDGALDDRLSSHGYDTAAEDLAAAAMGADKVLFSTNGSSLSLHTAILTVAAPGEELLVARNLHKSNMNALILGGARPVFVRPDYDSERQIAHTVTPDALRAAFAEHPAARGAVVVSPTYYGIIADVPALAEVCHARGVPLIVDDAWGAHFLFHPDLPEAAIAAGADIAVSSLHKAGSGLMQGSVIAVRGDRVDTARLQHTLGLLESTSTSMLILSALDGARRQLALHGEELLGRTIALARRLRAGAAEIPGLSVMGREVLAHPAAIDLDETKVCIEVGGLGITGYAASDWLMAERDVALEVADHRRMMALVTLGDSDATIDRLLDSLRGLAEAAPSIHRPDNVAVPDYEHLVTDCVMRPRDAFFAANRAVPLAAATGHVAAESVTPYPPGIPAILPGERWTPALIDYLRTGVENGMHIAEAADTKLGTVLVVDEAARPASNR
jgi:arginine/lysine/ornithine decarboxylase